MLNRRCAINYINARDVIQTDLLNRLTAELIEHEIYTNTAFQDYLYSVAHIAVKAKTPYIYETTLLCEHHDTISLRQNALAEIQRLSIYISEELKTDMLNEMRICKQYLRTSGHTECINNILFSTSGYAAMAA